MNVTLLQWNIWYKEDIGNVAKLLQQYKPDIVCLQELTRNFAGQSHNDTVQYIAGTLGYEHHSQEMPIERPGRRWQQANGIFTRFPITHKRSAWVNQPTGTGGYDDEYRAYIEATLDVHGRQLTIGTAHMSYTHRFVSTQRKEREAAALAKELQKRAGNFIFTGDLNATPDSFTVKKVSGHLQNAGPEYSQNTWTTKRFSHNGFEEAGLNWRLDYIFTTPDIKVTSCEIIRTDYSDHLPLLAAFELAGRVPG